MIEIDELRPSDVGRLVRYERPGCATEHGRITSWNEHNIFVRYSRNPQGTATLPEDLTFADIPDMSAMS